MIPYLTEDIGKTSPAAATWTGAVIKTKGGKHGKIFGLVSQFAIVSSPPYG